MPSLLTMTYQQVEIINSKASVFRTGTLVFHKEDREAIFTALGADNWKETYWSEEDIENLLTAPTVDELNRFLSVKDILTIDRIVSKMNFLRNTSSIPPSTRVVDMVNYHAKEVRDGKRSSDLVATPVDAGVTKEMSEARAVKEQNAILQERLAKMQAELDALKDAQNKSTPSTPPVRKTTAAKKT